VNCVFLITFFRLMMYLTNSNYIKLLEQFLHDVSKCFVFKGTKVRDCQDAQKNWPWGKSGVYTIYPKGGNQPVKVYCDMDTDKGGWTVNIYIYTLFIHTYIYLLHMFYIFIYHVIF